MQAADHIEKNPSMFRFMFGQVPGRERGCGCALAWIGFFSGMDSTFCHIHVANQVLGMGHGEFYQELEKHRPQWMYDAKQCAEAMRLYAEERYGSHKPTPPRADELDQLLEDLNKAVDSRQMLDKVLA
jgi:hypothetical protein